MILVLQAAACRPAPRGGVPSLVTETFATAGTLDGPAQGPGAIHIWEITGPAGRLGYLAETRCTTRSGAFLLRVVTDTALTVRRTEVSQYTAQRGIEITAPAFGRQFVGKTAADPIRVGRDVDAITGATLSSRSMADGIRAVLDALRRHAAAP